MASNTEATFGAKIANASAISTHLKSFIGYIAPTADTSIVNYDALIEATKVENSNVIRKKSEYSTAVDTRQKHFSNLPTSVGKLLSPIAATLRAKLGKDAKEVNDISVLITKIRGERATKPKEGDTKEKISQSERSFGSMTQNFADIVSTLTALGTNYIPVNELIKLPNLQVKITEINQANNAVASAYGGLKVSADQRNSLYETLAERTQRIKESIKSQYGVGSMEYKLIKGLKV